MRMPALAVVGADHQIVRSTETFRRQCDDAAALCDRAPELDLVLTGHADTAVVDLGDFSVSIEAVTDARGQRHAVLSLPAEDRATDPEETLAALREAAADSQAIVWAKDLEGRYLYVNARFEQYLETSEDRLRGNTDADLPPVETVDGPRLRYIEDGLEEPLQLEYTVPAYESRPAMAAFRFPLRDGAGQPIATCGVAAASSESQLATDEAVRLMQLERWSRLDPLDVRAELLEQWHVHASLAPAEAETEEALLESLTPTTEAAIALDEPAPADTIEPTAATAAPVEVEPAEAELEPAGPAQEDAGEASREDGGPSREDGGSSREDGGPAREDGSYHREDEWVRQLRQAARISDRDALSETADALHSELQLAGKWAERADQLQGDLQQAHARLIEAEAEAQQAAAAAQLAADEAKRYQAELEKAGQESLEYKAELERARSESGRDRAELERVREELEQERAEAEAVRTELDAARHEAEVARRELGAARTQSESLRAPSDAALRLSEELGRALAAERERGDELARVLARVRSRLGDLESALDRSKGATER